MESSLLDIVTALPSGHPIAIDQLHALGISSDLASYYVRAGWLTRIARGVYMRPGQLDLYASISVLNKTVPGLHVGGKTALSWHGIQVRSELIDLYGYESRELPPWFSDAFRAKYHRVRLFNEDPANPLHLKPVLVSSIERALLEVLNEAGTRRTLDEIKLIFESTYGLRENVLIELLEHCISSKTIRLCLRLKRESGAYGERFGKIEKTIQGKWIRKTPDGVLVL